jgi:hypothetical protein
MTLMREKSASITISIETDGWVKLSAGQESPDLRVKHCRDDQAVCSAGIQTNRLTAIERAALLDDAYALSKPGISLLPVLFELSWKLRGRSSLHCVDRTRGYFERLECYFQKKCLYGFNRSQRRWFCGW